MISFLQAIWIKSRANNKDAATDFFKTVDIKKEVKKEE